MKLGKKLQHSKQRFATQYKMSPVTNIPWMNLNMHIYTDYVKTNKLGIFDIIWVVGVILLALQINIIIIERLFIMRNLMFNNYCSFTHVVHLRFFSCKAIIGSKPRQVHDVRRGEHDYLCTFFSTELTNESMFTSSYISSHNKCTLACTAQRPSELTVLLKAVRSTANAARTDECRRVSSSLLHSSWRSQKCNAEHRTQYSTICICLTPMVYISNQFQVN